MGARVLFAFLGLALPIGLALGVYAAAGRSLTAASVADPVTVTTRVIAEPSPTTTERAEREQDDRSGRCQEPEHRADPECVSGGATEDDRDSSGSGSDSSGPGSGSGDSSGSGSSGSSGSGSGSSGSSGSGDD